VEVDRRERLGLGTRGTPAIVETIAGSPRGMSAAPVAVACVALLLAFVPISPTPASDETTADCAGVEATISGTDGDDVLEGTNKHDVIMGGAGADEINGRAGNDRICGGTGRDRLTGGKSHGSERWERLLGGRGRDTLFFAGGGSVNIFLRARGPRRGGLYKSAGLGAARVIGIENIRGTKYADRLRGDSNANRLRGRKGPDMIQGRPGEDVLSGGHGDDEVDGGRGRDRCRTSEDTTACE
jgi:Ca2+-binding RTX toxin-like protein